MRWATVATIGMGRKEGAAVPLSPIAENPSNTKWPGLVRPHKAKAESEGQGQSCKAKVKAKAEIYLQGQRQGHGRQGLGQCLTSLQEATTNAWYECGG